MARTYTMRRRAESVDATRTKILDSARDLLVERLAPEAITIEETASRAGVSAMTVARHFRSKAALIAALGARERERVTEIRRAPAGDIATTIKGLYDHYEEAGDMGLRMQALEHVRPGMHEILKRARAHHRSWVEAAFAPQLGTVPRSERDELVTALVVACDLLTWKQLRKDFGFSRRRAESIVRRMVSALTRED
jgi:AcrR family transcriptional regulator